MTGPGRRGLNPSRSQLSNGTVILAKESRVTPAVTLHAQFSAGSAFDPFLAFVVLGHESRLSQVFRNLLDNARKWARTRVQIHVRQENGSVEICVDDDGPGIPPAERDNVFRPFYRLDNARNQDKGNSGLGLAIARDIARSHGGDISLGVSSMGGLRATMRVPL